jgi:diacylglycerol kinase (ATP)
MTVGDSVAVIVNPAAGRGRGARVLAGARSELARYGITRIHMTDRAGEETILARRAIEGGASTLIAVGGDGTWSRVARAIVESDSGCRLALLAAGTGNDFAKSLGVPARDAGRTVQLAVEGSTRVVDVGMVDDVPFLNAAGFGFDAAVLAAMARMRWPGGTALYVRAALSQLVGFRALEVEIDSAVAQRLLLLVVANGCWFGGAFRIAPGARLDDGLLDTVTIGDAGTLKRMSLLASATRGAHVGMSGVDTRTGETLSLRFARAPVFQADGELYEAVRRDVVVRCLPGALRTAVEPHRLG